MAQIQIWKFFGHLVSLVSDLARNWIAGDFPDGHFDENQWDLDCFTESPACGMPKVRCVSTWY